MGRLAAIDKLSREDKEWLNNFLIENKFSQYDEATKLLEQRGYKIGRSSVHRYGQKMEEEFKAEQERLKQLNGLSPDELLLLELFRGLNIEQRKSALHLLFTQSTTDNKPSINNSFNGNIENSFNTEKGFTQVEYLIFALVCAILSWLLAIFANQLLSKNFLASLITGVSSIIFWFFAVGSMTILYCLFPKKRT